VVKIKDGVLRQRVGLLTPIKEKIAESRKNYVYLGFFQQQG
jgi:hypothetical protein